MTQRMPWAGTIAVALLLAVATAAVAPMLGAGVAQAQEQGQKEERKVRRTPALRQKVFEGLGEAATLMEEKQLDAALGVLQEMLNDTGRGKLNAYEAAMVWRNVGLLHYQQENFDKAINAFNQVIAQENIPYALEAEMTYTLAQLYMVIEDYGKAIQYLNQWFQVADNPGPNAYILLSQAHLQLKQYDKSLAAVEKAMALADERGIEPRENWYLLLRVLYYEKGDYQKVAGVLEELVRRWPKKDYWVQLAMMYSQLDRPKDAMHTLETAYEQDMLSKKGELMMLAQLYASYEMPYKAAKVIERGLEKDQIEPTGRVLEFLGDAWRRAQEVEKALPVLARAAAKAEEGEAFIRLAYVYFSVDRYEDAAEAIRRGLKKGGVKDPGAARLLLGQSLFHAKDFQAAGQAFEQIANSKKHGKTARQWLDYMDREIDRQKQIEEFLG